MNKNHAVLKFALTQLAGQAIKYFLPDVLPDLAKDLIAEGLLALPAVWRYCAAQLAATKTPHELLPAEREHE